MHERTLNKRNTREFAVLRIRFAGSELTSDDIQRCGRKVRANLNDLAMTMELYFDSRSV